jgi:hypothetical protein
MLLNRLQNVQKRGDQYKACCPVHESISRSSLSIRETEDGRILVYCFGGCEVMEILKVCGMEMQDLMPERLTHNASPEQKQKWREYATHKDWCEARDVIEHETLIVMMSAVQLGQGKPLGIEESRRLNLAYKTLYQEGRILNDK